MRARVNEPKQTTAMMYFDSQQALDNYKASKTFQDLVESLTTELLDKSKPVTEEIFKIIDI